MVDIGLICYFTKFIRCLEIYECHWICFLTITCVYKHVSDDRVRISKTTRPPPSTVSNVRARRLGVNASKSWMKKTVTKTVHLGKEKKKERERERRAQIEKVIKLVISVRYLEYTHSKSTAQNFFWILIQTTSYFFTFHKRRKWISSIRIQKAPLSPFFDLLLMFFHMTAFKIVLNKFISLKQTKTSMYHNTKQIHQIYTACPCNTIKQLDWIWSLPG